MNFKGFPNKNGVAPQGTGGQQTGDEDDYSQDEEEEEYSNFEGAS